MANFYVAEDGVSNYITEWTADFGVTYVAEDGITPYIQESALFYAYVPEDYQANLDTGGTAVWAGIGGWSLPFLVETGQPVVATTWNGVGSLQISLQNMDVLATMAWNGQGSWFANPIPAHFAPPPLLANWNGVGGMTFDLIPTFVGPVLTLPVWTGVGGWLASTILVAAPQQYPPNFCLIDPVWRRLYNDTMQVGEATTLLFNAGVPINNPVLTITRPDGSSYQGISNLVLVGQVDFPSQLYFGPTPTPSFRANQYVVYPFNAGELDQAGTWMATLQTSAVSVTMPFTVFNLGITALAA